MRTGYVIITASGWAQCDTDEDFGFAAAIWDSSIYPDFNQAAKARDDLIEAEKKEFAATYVEDGEEDRVDFGDGGTGALDDEKYVQFFLDDEMQSETKYYIKQVFIRD